MHFSLVCSSNAGLLARVGAAAELGRLLDERPDCDARDNRGWTPLHEAAFARSLPCLQLVLQRGRSYLIHPSWQLAMCWVLQVVWT